MEWLAVFKYEENIIHKQAAVEYIMLLILDTGDGPLRRKKCNIYKGVFFKSP